MGVSIAYCMAASNPMQSKQLIKFIIYLKMFAFIFLMIYFIFVLQSWLILLSGIGDGFMGVTILILLRLSNK